MQRTEGRPCAEDEGGEMTWRDQMHWREGVCRVCGAEVRATGDPAESSFDYLYYCTKCDNRAAKGDLEDPPEWCDASQKKVA